MENAVKSGVTVFCIYHYQGALSVYISIPVFITDFFSDSFYDFYKTRLKCKSCACVKIVGKKD